MNSINVSKLDIKELPRKWRISITILRILALALPVAFVWDVWMTLGSLLKVMLG